MAAAGLGKNSRCGFMLCHVAPCSTECHCKNQPLTQSGSPQLCLNITSPKLKCCAGKSFTILSLGEGKNNNFVLLAHDHGVNVPVMAGLGLPTR